MEKHDHPLAWQRLGDLEAGLGAAATLSFADAEAIRQIDGVQYVACGLHGNARVHISATSAGSPACTAPTCTCSTSSARGRCAAAASSPTDEQDDKAMVVVLGSVVAEKLFGEGVEPGRARTVTLWNQPFEIVGVVTSASWVVRPAPGDDEFDAVYMPYTTTHQLAEPDQAERHHRDRGVDRRGVGPQQADRRAAAPAARHHRREARRLHDLDAGHPCDRHRRPAAGRRGGDRRQRQGAGAGHARTAGRHARAGQRHDALAAGGGGGGVAAGRRHRHHEHHAALGHRTHQGDRPAHGGGRPRPRRHAAVPDRGGGDQRGRRPGRHRARAGRRRI